MTRSSTSASDPAPPAAASIVDDALRHWRGGIGVMLLVASVLTFRGLHAASHVYESRVTFGPSDGIAAVAGAGANEASAQAGAPRLEDALQKALPQLEHLRGSSDEALGPDSATVLGLGKDRAVLVCRADGAHTAHQRCAQLATTALQAVRSLRIVEPATLASRPLPAASNAGAVVLFVAAMIGVLGGSLWMLACTLLPALARVAPSFARDSAPLRTTRSSLPPPAQEQGGSEPRARHTASASESAGPRRDSNPGAKPILRRERGPRAEVESRALVAVSVVGDWTIDPTLDEPEPDADLQTLCDRFEAGDSDTEGFVVGVTSRPDQRPLKARMAARLAWLLAQNEQARVLLVEFDLNHPSVDTVMQLAMPPGAGFSQQIQAQVHETARAPWTVVRCTPNLSVLAEGRLRTPGVAYFRQFPDSLASLRPHFDVIVAHGPSTGNKPEATAFANLVDGIVFAIPADAPKAAAETTATKWFGSAFLAVATLRDPLKRAR